MGKKAKIILVSLIFILAVVFGFFIFTEGSSELVGENDLGSVTRVDHSYSDNASIKIAVVSGMHSREKLHLFVLPLVCRYFALTHRDVDVINYRVQVTDSPEDFNRGRANGESLVHDYVVSDVAKQDPDLSLGRGERPIGGMGIFLSKKLMDEMTYEYKDGQNILTIKKNL